MKSTLRKVKLAGLLLLIGATSLFLFSAGWAGSTAMAADDGINAPAAVPTQPPAFIYLSSSANGTVGGVQFKDEDIVRYNGTSWELYFDGSKVGLSKADIDAFELHNGKILISLEKRIKNFDGIGTVEPADILEFTPTIIGNGNTAGSWALYFDGSTKDLTTSGENIDAITFDPDGNLVISTAGTAKVNGVALTAKDEDLLAWDGSTWSLYLDGSAIQLTQGNEDVGGAWIDPTGDKNIYLSTKGNFNATSNGFVATGDADDIFGVSPGAATPPITAGALFAFFDGDPVGFTKPIDGIHVQFTVVSVAAEGVSAAAIDEAAIVQYAVESDEADTTDAELDEFDAAVEDEAEVVTRLFLPAAFK